MAGNAVVPIVISSKRDMAELHHYQLSDKLTLYVPLNSLGSQPVLRIGAFAAKLRFMATIRSSLVIPDTPQLTDGRRERSRSSRSKIVAALLDLVGKGDVSHSAAKVAEVAGVGLCSELRRFGDMDALYREMGEVIEARILPISGGLNPPT